MKILLLTSTCSLNGGGISSYAHELISIFENKFDVISGDSPPQELNQRINSHCKINPLDYSQTNALLLLKIIERINPDKIINSNFSLFGLILPYIKKEIMAISISHYVDGQIAIKAGFNIKYYDSIISLSNAGKEFIENFYNSRELNKIKVVYNFYSSKTNTINDKSQDSPLKIVFPGGSSLQKNVILVTRILRELQRTKLPFKFYWLGNTKLPGNRFFNTGTISDLFPADERIVFTGFINRNEATEIIGNANIFLLPSLKEGCPISLLEALSNGVIPIVSDAKHASSELIEDKVTGFVLPSNEPKPYIHLITDIINNHSYYHHIYKSTKDLYDENLDGIKWKKEMKEILIDETLNSYRKPQSIDFKNFIKDRLKLFLLVGIERTKEFYKSVKGLLFFKFS